MPIYINDTLLETFKFSGGECHLNISKYNFTVPVTITAYLYSSDDIISLLLLDDAITGTTKKMSAIRAIHHLIIPYFPYARQDRVCNPGEPFSLEVIARLIDSLSFYLKVTVIDPHSKVTTDLMFRRYTETISIAEIISDSKLPEFIRENNLTLIAPDKGAKPKVLELVDKLLNMSLSVNYLTANKVRDTITGKIISTEIEGDVKDKNCIIIDDICDGGATFIELAKKLKGKGAGDLYLYVTHGIFSKGLWPLKEYFNHVYCYHTMLCEFELNKSYLTILKKGP